MQSKLIFLSVPVPVATILGESEIYLDAGSTINITCVVKHTPVPPSHVQWEHQGKVKWPKEHHFQQLKERHEPPAAAIKFTLSLCVDIKKKSLNFFSGSYDMIFLGGEIDH